MSTLPPLFPTLPDPGAPRYTDQPSDGPDTTDIPQPDSEAEFFEGAQSVINEAYGDIIRAWGNGILSNAVTMDDVPEFLRGQVQGYIDYTTGQTEEVEDVLSGDTELQGDLDSVADSLTGASGTEEEVLTEEELARIRIEERDELARILREQAERDRYFGATAEEWNSMSPEERSEQYDRYFENLFRDAEWQENLANEQRLAEERSKNYGKTDAEWAEMSEEERAEQQAAWLKAQEDIEEAQAGLISIGQSSEEDQEKVGGIFQSATEIAKQAGGVIAKVFESIFTPPDIEELPGGSKWVPPGTIIGVRNELPGGTGGLLGPKFVKTLILAVPTLPGKPLEIPLTDDEGNWLPAGDIGNNIYQQTTRPIRDLVGAVQDKIGEIGSILTEEGTNVFEAVLNAGGEILSGPLDILINTMGEDGAAEFLGGIITTGLESGFGEEDSGTQDDLGVTSTEDLGKVTEDTSGGLTGDTSEVSTEDTSGVSTGDVSGAGGSSDDSEELTLGGVDDPSPVDEVVEVTQEPVIPCFVSGTKIDMADGTQKNIEDISVGDKVQAIDGKIDTVSYVHDIPVQDHVLWTLNGRITATEAHPFLTTEGWKSANPEASAPIYESYGIAIGKLEVGDILVGSSGNVELSSLESKEDRVKVYNFTTESTHTYMVDGVVSHNKSTPEPIRTEPIVVTGYMDPNYTGPPIIKDPLKQDRQTGIPLGQHTFPTEPIEQIRTDAITTNLPPPAPFQDFEQEITQDIKVVEPPIPEPEPEIIIEEPPLEPPLEPPPIVEPPPPPPPPSGGGGMLGGTPKGYMADLPYQLPRFMGVPYDPGDPVEQLNRIILEGLFSQ